MKLVWSTEEFQVGGVSVSGFPIHLASDGAINTAVHSFLVTQLLQHGSASSEATWKFYGYALLGFLSFLESNGRVWDEPSVEGVPSIVAAFRIWMLKNSKRSRGTINGYLDVICRFYMYARKHGLIGELPFGFVERVSLAEYESGTHSTRSNRKTHLSPNVKLRTPRRTVNVLSAAQANMFIRSLENKTHGLMARLQLATGIRVEELVTFPAACVVDPRDYPSVRAFFSVLLDPKKMSTKGSVERTIHLPRELMNMLWAYRSVERAAREKNSTSPHTELFLTEEGNRYRTRSIWKLYQASTVAVGTRVNPHLLRHTYATHTLRSLAKVKNIGNALFYVRNRLGHASIKTTEVYLHYIDDVVVSVMDQYQSELTAIATSEVV